MNSEQTNVDKAEVIKFNQLRNDWWDLSGPLKTLHVINPVRLGFITQNLDLRDKDILDVGCGGGILSEALASKAKHVTAIDLSESAINIANSHARQNGLNNILYEHISTEYFAESHQESFDVITCMEMLEHVPEPSSIIQACSCMLKPGGFVFFATLNRNLSAYLKALIAAEHVLKLLPKGTHDYAKFIKPSELIAPCRKQGLVIDEIIGLHYLPFLNKAYLSKKIDSNYMIRAGKPAK